MSLIEHSIQSKDTYNILPWIYYSCLYEEKNRTQKCHLKKPLGLFCYKIVKNDLF